MERYTVCGHSAIGKSHEIKGMKCQDNCHFKVTENIIVAAVADGLSSSKYSDIASRIAVKTIVNYCIKNINYKDKEEIILEKIKRSFEQALLQIELKAGEDDLNFYDTTVSAAVIKDQNLYYGQIGDSGIIALLQNGKFERITDAQNGEGIGKNKTVYPLAATDKWIFKRYENKVNSIYLATDGVLKHLQPPLLEGHSYTLNHRYLSWIYNKLMKREVDSFLWIKEEVEKLKPENVDFDDKTLVVIINKKGLISTQTLGYYNFPSPELWEKLLKKNEAKLYPYRYNKIQPKTENIEGKNELKKLLSNETIQTESVPNKNIKIKEKINLRNNKSFLGQYNKYYYLSLGLLMASIVFLFLFFLRIL